MKIKALALAAASVVFTVGAPASALTINLNNIGGLTYNAQKGFRQAADYWQSVLTNDAVVNFDVGFDHLGEGILGGTSSSLFTYVDIDTYQSLLAATGTTNLDAIAIANLAPTSATGSVTVIVPDYLNAATLNGIATSGARIAPDGQAISNTLALSTANLKALIGGFETVTDAQIIFSSDFKFDYDPSNGIRAGYSDFIGVAIHEMGHALGFLSGADDFDYSAGSGGYNPDDYWWGYGLDMFRYSAPGQLNWNFNTPSYFSIDGGATEFNGRSGLSTGSNYGDGWQASHWKAPQLPNGDFSCAMPKIGVMNPYLCDGQRAIVTGADLALLDAIGWNTDVDVLANPGYAINTGTIFAATFVPEPAQWALMLSGFGLLGGALRRRKAAQRVTYA